MGFKKGVKITDKTVLERLARARTKALETRRKNSLIKQQEKEKIKKKALETLQPPPQIQQEPQQEPQQGKRLKRKTKKRIVYVTDSSETDSETEEYEVRRPKSWSQKRFEKDKANEMLTVKKEASKLRADREIALAEAASAKKEREFARAEAAILKKEHQDREQMRREKKIEKEEERKRVVVNPKPQKSVEEINLNRIFKRCYGNLL